MAKRNANSDNGDEDRHMCLSIPVERYQQKSSRTTTNKIRGKSQKLDNNS